MSRLVFFLCFYTLFVFVHKDIFHRWQITGRIWTMFQLFVGKYSHKSSAFCSIVSCYCFKWAAWMIQTNWKTLQSQLFTNQSSLMTKNDCWNIVRAVHSISRKIADRKGVSTELVWLHYDDASGNLAEPWQYHGQQRKSWFCTNLI